MEPTEIKHLRETDEGRALLKKWEAILKSEGLSMDRGRLHRHERPVVPQDHVVCAQCIGFHTEEPGCQRAYLHDENYDV